MNRAVIAWSATIPLAYHFLYPAAGHAAASDAGWTLRGFEMAPVAGALLWDLRAWRQGRRAGAIAAVIAIPPPLLQPVRVAIVMPALDEEEPLPLVFADLAPLRRGADHGGADGLIDEIVLVDNGSRDRTPAIAHAAGATVLAEPARGYGAACLRGLAHLRAHPPGIVLFMDADRSDDAQDIPAVLQPLLAGDADLVIGSRTRGVQEPGALLPQARFGNWLATGWIRAWYGFRYTDLGPFRAIRWDGLEKLAMRDRDWGWTLEMQVRALQEGLRVVEVPVRYRRRIGKSKISGTVLGSYRAGRKILWMMWTLRRPVRQDDTARR
jgi:glycosyltransferase involved in cell wall biosynthesis